MLRHCYEDVELSPEGVDGLAVARKFIQYKLVSAYITKQSKALQYSLRFLKPLSARASRHYAAFHLTISVREEKTTNRAATWHRITHYKTTTTNQQLDIL